MSDKKGGVKSWMIIFVVILAALVFLLLQSPKTPTETGSDATPDQTISEVKRPGVPKAPEAPKAEKIKAEKVTLVQALKQSAPEKCDELVSSQILAMSCKDSINFSMAMQFGRESYCQSIEDATIKTRCLDKIYHELALNDEDSTLCEKIEDIESKTRCIDQVLIAGSQSATDLTYCDDITDAEMQKNCLDNIYYNLGTSLGNGTHCANIQNAVVNEKCFRVVELNAAALAAARANPEVTSKSEAERREGCQNLQGANRQNCLKVVETESVLTSKDITKCNALGTRAEIQNCQAIEGAQVNYYYLRKALAEKNPSLCNNIQSLTLKESCLEISQ